MRIVIRVPWAGLICMTLASPSSAVAADQIPLDVVGMPSEWALHVLGESLGQKDVSSEAHGGRW